MTQENLSMEHVPVGELQPNPWNTNRITDPANEQKLRESLQRLGQFKPVIVRTLENGQLEILGGEHRWRGAIQLGWDTVPIINLGRIDDHRAKEIGLVDNGRYGEDDPIGLSALLRDLGNDIFTILPVSDFDLAALEKVSSINLDDLDKTPPEQLPNLNDLKPAPSSQVMRFKVPVADVAWVTTMIEQEMKRGNYTDEDALSNAGNAFVALLSRLRNGN
jgi:ParB family transcriptional regulator, chromosome partitioning protein